MFRILVRIVDRGVKIELKLSVDMIFASSLEIFFSFSYCYFFWWRFCSLLVQLFVADCHFYS